MDRAANSDGVRSYLSRTLTRGVGSIRRAKRHIAPVTPTPMTTPPSSSRGSSGQQTPASALSSASSSARATMDLSLNLTMGCELASLAPLDDSDELNPPLSAVAADDDDDDSKPILARPAPEPAQRSTRVADLPVAQHARESARRARRKRMELDFASLAYQDGMRFSSFD